MPESTDTRPWWRRKTTLGVLAIGASGIIKAVSYFQTSPAREALGEIAGVLYTFGNALGVYGVADRVSKKASNKKGEK